MRIFDKATVVKQVASLNFRREAAERPKYSRTVSAATACRKPASSASSPAVYLLPTGDFFSIAA